MLTRLRTAVNLIERLHFIHSAICAGLILSVAGCTPSGPRALLKGKKLLDRGKYSLAVEALTNATALLATNAQAWNYLGLAYHYSGKLTDAQQAYQRAISLNPDLSEARFNLGCLYLEQKKSELAKSELTAFTLRRNNSAEAFVK